MQHESCIFIKMGTVSETLNSSASCTSKPRHIPAFREVADDTVYRGLGYFCSAEDMELITQFYSVGMIGLVRVQKDDDHVEGFISDICKRCTKLAIDKPPSTASHTTFVERPFKSSDGSTLMAANSLPDVLPSPSTLSPDVPCETFSTASVGFTNRSKRWTLCPSKKCCDSAADRDKIVGQWKILKLAGNGEELEVPKSIRNSYDMIMDDSDYFVSTLCPQQTYHSKHSPQGTQAVFDLEWHYTLRYRFPDDVVLFVDDDLNTRAVWRMKTKGMRKYSGDGEKAEAKLIELMILVLRAIRSKQKIVLSYPALKVENDDIVSQELHVRLLQ